EQWEADAVEVVADHEVERESGAGEVLLVPIPVGTLDTAKIVSGSSRISTLSVSCGHVAEERPGGLRRRCEGCAPAPGRIGVRADVLAEAARLLLNRVEPPCCAPDSGVVTGNAARLERGQGGARPVEMVDAPAAEPGAVGLLLVEEPREAALARIVVAGL